MGNRLYVGNLSFQTKAETIRTSFSAWGEVTDVHVVTDRETGQPRGFAFVTMGNAQEAAKAIAEMNGALLDGRPLRVNEAEERQPRAGGGGGGFGGGGGGGRGIGGVVVAAAAAVVVAAAAATVVVAAATVVVAAAIAGSRLHMSSSRRRAASHGHRPGTSLGRCLLFWLVTGRLREEVCGEAARRCFRRWCR